MVIAIDSSLNQLLRRISQTTAAQFINTSILPNLASQNVKTSFVTSFFSHFCRDSVPKFLLHIDANDENAGDLKIVVSLWNLTQNIYAGFLIFEARVCV